MYDYPLTLEPDEGTVLVTVPDIPGCRTYGEDEADAIAQAVNAVHAMISAYMEERIDIPDPSPANGRPTVRLPLLTALKVRLYMEMRRQGVTQVEMAKRLGKTQKEVWRLLDPTHGSKIDQIERAFAALNLRIDADVRTAA